jgi:tetratricopeptide (TPR) repeat protein
MKKAVILISLCLPISAIAQKEIKPSIPKAEKALRAGKYDEAKSIIDVTVANQEFMVNKKGEPSKNAAQAWYMKGLVYFGIDTTKNQAAKSLEANPYQVAVEAFAKSQSIDKTVGKGLSEVKDAQGFLPLTYESINSTLAQSYLTKALQYYEKEKEYKKAFENMERVVYFLPADTTMLLNAGVYFGPGAEEYDKSIPYIEQYVANGGKNSDAYLQLISIYQDKKKDMDKALSAIKEARVKFPKNPDFPKYELNIYLTQKKYDLAKKTIKGVLAKNPTEKESFYLLAQLHNELNNVDSAKMAYQKAVDIDPQYFEAQLDLAKMYLIDANKTKSERDKLGITPNELTKRKELFMVLQKKYETALPYWERAEKIRPDDETVLYRLAEIYSALVMDDKADKVNKRIKALGLDN